MIQPAGLQVYISDHTKASTISKFMVNKNLSEKQTSTLYQKKKQ